MTFLVLWRIDLGYTCLVVMSLMLLYYHFFDPHFKIDWTSLFKGLLTVLIFIAALIGAISICRNVNLFKKVINTLNYLSSAQTYGYSGIGSSETATFRMHYFILPLIVSIILLALVLKFRNLNRSRNQRLAYLALFFACGFYLINFNRGLVRHSLLEWVDHFTTSYLYIIVPAATFIFFRNTTHITKYLSFCGIGFFSPY